MGRWTLLESETVLDTQWISVARNRYSAEGGDIVDEYYVVQRDDFVLAVACNADRVVLVRQYRPATDQFYLGVPAGFLRPGESPESGAKRELLEETGFSATSCRLIGELHPLPGYIRSTAFVVFCDVCGKGLMQVDSAEIDEVVEISWGEVTHMIANGEINEMQAVSALLLAKEILGLGEQAGV
jgi:8-oxo-dGTP pyrophosphatase MutT (NUDIX family)